MISEVIDSINNVHVAAATDFNLQESAALISRMNIFITVDTGLMHIASATQTPIIALFGPGDIHKFSPYRNSKISIVRKDIRCFRPCFKYNCKTCRCMDLFEVNDVLEEVKKYV